MRRKRLVLGAPAAAASYLIVENHVCEHADFAYWREAAQAEQFRNVFQPAVIQMDFRLPALENPARQHGVTRRFPRDS